MCVSVLPVCFKGSGWSLLWPRRGRREGGIKEEGGVSGGGEKPHGKSSKCEGRGGKEGGGPGNFYILV